MSSLKLFIKHFKHKLPFLFSFYKRIVGLKNSVINYPLIKKSKFYDDLLVREKLNKTRSKPLKVLFMVIHESVWKLDSIYKKMSLDVNFNPEIVICPYTRAGHKTMLRDMHKAYEYFSSRGYNVRKAVTSNGILINIKEELSPDLIFFTNPHDVTFKEFQAESYLDVLSIYIPYSHQISRYENYQPQYNQLFHNLMWKIFTTNTLDKHIFCEHSDRKGDNVVVAGYPGTEYLLGEHSSIAPVWKVQSKLKKKIIYAPHHTIAEDCTLGYSTFLKYSEDMLKFVEMYNKEVQFAFKPHPLLRDKLADENIWGKKATDKYYDFWKSQTNTQFEDSEYLDLFLQSDAIIHDSGSFLAEYLYVNKPSLYLFSSEKAELPYNPFGLLCLDVYSKGYNCFDIESFILDVINGNDKKYLTRTEFVKNSLINYEDNILPSDFILKYLKNELVANRNV
jgi:hypothetical protein